MNGRTRKAICLLKFQRKITQKTLYKGPGENYDINEDSFWEYAELNMT